MIVILCGPVGAGKTTVCERLMTRLDEKGFDFKMIHSDDFSTHTYDQMFDRVKGSDDNWILDGTFYKEDIRDKFRRLDDVQIVWLKAELETCMERNKQRKEPLEKKIVHIMFHKFEEPDKDLKIETDDLSSDEVAYKILKEIFEMEEIK